MALTITAKYGKPVCIGDDILITPYKKDGSGVTLVISAPKEIAIHRYDVKVKK